MSSRTFNVGVVGATGQVGVAMSQILEEQGGSLASITSATLFCKDRAAYEAWQRVSRLLRIPAIPKISVLADVCRHDLLVEMEAVATI